MAHGKRLIDGMLMVLLTLTLGACSSDDVGASTDPDMGAPDDSAVTAGPSDDPSDSASTGDTDTGDADGGDTDSGGTVDPPENLVGIPGADRVPLNESGTDPMPPLETDDVLPIVFVHGFAGSAQQFESQAQRFAANGYPQEMIKAYDHDGAGLDLAGYTAGAGEVIDAALAEFGTSQVYLVGHSRGTSVSNMYLGNADNAAKVAKYVSLDGRGCTVSVDCIAPSQDTNPGQAHVEVATSKETFVMMYEFFLGTPPEVVDIVPQRDPVVIEGRAVHFPANTGRDGATLEIWELEEGSAERATDEPHATFEIGTDGNFGPVVVDSSKRYEFVLIQDGAYHHLYPQRFLRDDFLVRLLSGDSNSATRMNTNSGPNHSSIVATRMREWYAMDDPDLEGDQTDILEISVQSEAGNTDPVNAITPSVGNGGIGIHIHDAAASPGDSTLEDLPYFSDQPFQAGVDVYMPAADPPNGTITVTNYPRGDMDKPQTLYLPNWPSEGHAMSVLFTDFPVD